MRLDVMGRPHGRRFMPKKQTYTVPVTLRLSTGMMEYVDGQASERGLTAVDFIRYAISFIYWESEFVRQQAKATKERPMDYLGDFETMCQELDNPNSHANREREHRIQIWRKRGLIP